MFFRAYRYRLKPTPAQTQALAAVSGVCRMVYNLAWEQRATWGARHRINFATQCQELTHLRAQLDWIAAVPRECQEAALRDLDGAFKSFFAGRTGFPTPRRKGVNDSARYRAAELRVTVLNRKWANLRLPKLGDVRLRLTRPLGGEIVNVTVSFECGAWWASVVCEVACEPLGLADAVGIDRGVCAAYALSSGEIATLPDNITRLDAAIGRAQRRLSRRDRGSKRYAAQRARVAKLRSKAKRARQHFNHVATTRIADRFGVAAIEDLKVAAMTRSAKGTVEAPGKRVAQKAGLNRVILQRGWFQFETFLGYKLAERGGRLMKVSPAYTSQTCSACGVVDARSRESQARFVCVGCGHRDNADVNAAKNILRRSTALLDVEGAHLAPREASTELAA